MTEKKALYNVKNDNNDLNFIYKCSNCSRIIYIENSDKHSEYYCPVCNGILFKCNDFINPIYGKEKDF